MSYNTLAFNDYKWKDEHKTEFNCNFFNLTSFNVTFDVTSAYDDYKRKRAHELD